VPVWTALNGSLLRRVRFNAKGEPVAGVKRDFEWTLVGGKASIADARRVAISEPAKRAELERKVQAWCAGFRMERVRKDSPALFRGATGALVVGVVAASAGERAGVALGDIVIEVAGRKIDRPEDVQLALGTAQAGPRRVVLVRDGAAKEVELGSGDLGLELEPE
jgi:S1-C subfamily serine protease